MELHENCRGLPEILWEFMIPVKLHELPWDFHEFPSKLKNFHEFSLPKLQSPCRWKILPKWHQICLLNAPFLVTFFEHLAPFRLHVGSFGYHFDIILVALDAFWLHIGRSWCNFAPTLTLERSFPSTIQFAGTQFRKTPEHNRKSSIEGTFPLQYAHPPRPGAEFCLWQLR